jgi:hypothetical protein
MIERDHIYPYIAPESYLEVLGKGSYVAWDLGQGLVTMLCEGRGSVVGSLTPHDLASIGLDADAAYTVSLENLHRWVSSDDFVFGVLTFDSGEKVIVIENHWLSSAVALHGGVYKLAAEVLGQSALHIALPSRDNAVILPSLTLTTVSDKLYTLVDELSRRSRKPFGRKLFAFTESGAVDNSSRQEQ